MGLSASFHDSVFAVGSIVLFFALLPAVIHRSILPISTCLTTGGVLFIFSLNYLTMEYWYATVVESANVVIWIMLLYRGWKASYGTT